MDSILDSTKKVLGIDESYTAFDVDIIMHINTTFGKLSQFGIGPVEGYEIEDKTSLWSEYLVPPLSKLYNPVKTYMYLNVRLLFDLPPTSYAIQAARAQVDELGWRIQTLREEMEHPWPLPSS